MFWIAFLLTFPGLCFGSFFGFGLNSGDLFLEGNCSEAIPLSVNFPFFGLSYSNVFVRKILSSFRFNFSIYFSVLSF